MKDFTYVYRAVFKAAQQLYAIGVSGHTDGDIGENIDGTGSHSSFP